MGASPYREPVPRPPEPPDPWTVAWRDLRTRRVVAVLALALGTALVGLLHGIAWYAVAVACVGIASTSANAAAFRCPRCGNRFQRSGRWWFNARCAECGVHTGTRGGPSRRDAGNRRLD